MDDCESSDKRICVLCFSVIFSIGLHTFNTSIGLHCLQPGCLTRRPIGLLQVSLRCDTCDIMLTSSIRAHE